MHFLRRTDVLNRSFIIALEGKKAGEKNQSLRDLGIKLSRVSAVLHAEHSLRRDLFNQFYFLERQKV